MKLPTFSVLAALRQAPLLLQARNLSLVAVSTATTTTTPGKFPANRPQLVGPELKRYHHCEANTKMLPRIQFSSDFFFRQTILNPKSCASAAKYSLHAEASDLKLTQLEATAVSGRECATTGRRRKGSSLGGTLSARAVRNDTKELRSALQDREAVIQNLRIQLCLGKLPRPTGPPLDESEKPAAEQKLQKLKIEADNKKIKIRNLKSALDKLDISDNIDVRIRQAELEYALGREELQLLSIVEECRALQARLEKSKPEAQTLYSIITSGVSLSLHAVHATTGRWAAHTKNDQPGFYVEWALEGDGLYKGDRILEVNGQLVTCQAKEELQKIVGNTGKCQMVVVRRKTTPIPQKQLDQEKENNMRLQHRISYLEEQVKELQTTKEHQHCSMQPSTAQPLSNANHNGHVTSISISSPPSTPPDKPLVFQRGNYITTLVGGKPIELLGDAGETPLTGRRNGLAKSSSSAHVTKTLIKENTCIDLLHDRTPISQMPPKSLSSSRISINSDSAYMQQHYRRERERHHHRDQQRESRYERSSSSKLSALQQQQQLHQQHRSNMHARSVEHLNHCNGLERRRECSSRNSEAHTLRPRHPADMRSVKSLDFDSENETKPISDTVSEVRSVRPTPPKKPLRLSLQRAQSLQTVELNASAELDRKRPLKRSHIKAKTANGDGGAANAILIENCSPLHTASLGRQKHNNI